MQKCSCAQQEAVEMIAGVTCKQACLHFLCRMPFDLHDNPFCFPFFSFCITSGATDVWSYPDNPWCCTVCFIKARKTRPSQPNLFPDWVMSSTAALSLSEHYLACSAESKRQCALQCKKWTLASCPSLNLKSLIFLSNAFVTDAQSVIVLVALDISCMKISSFSSWDMSVGTPNIFFRCMFVLHCW